jgi:polyhydroxyalkanoate synthesis regulator phasin
MDYKQKARELYSEMIVEYLEHQSQLEEELDWFLGEIEDEASSEAHEFELFESRLEELKEYWDGK